MPSQEALAVPPSETNVRRKGKNFDFGGVDFFRFGGSKNIVNLCSHIELNTQNPNPKLKTIISFTETPKMPKYFRKFRKIENRRISQFYFVLCMNCIIHIL